MDKLTKYAKDGNLEKVKKMLIKGAKFHLHKDNALYWSVRNGHLEVTIYLIEQGAIIRDGIMYYAIMNNHFEIIKYLVNGKYITNKAYGLSLVNSIVFGHIETVKYLFQNTNYCAHNYDNQKSLYLYYSTIYGHLDVINYLIEFNVFTYDEVLLFSAENNHSKAVSSLLTLNREDEIKTAINNDNKKILLKFLLRHNVTNYLYLINIFREKGIDVFDMIEKEKK